MSLSQVPAIIWNTAFANTWAIHLPIDFPNAGSEQRKGSEHATAPSGTRDAWVVGTDHILEGEIRHIPLTDQTPDENGNNSTGWDGATGVRAALEWLLDGNIGRFAPLGSSPGTYTSFYLEEPDRAFGSKEKDTNRRRLRIKLVAIDGDTFSGF